jgi:hypothetical protein
MRNPSLLMAVLLTSIAATPAHADADPRYPPLAGYMMSRDAEAALAKSAAPPNVADHASIKILTDTGYLTVVEGDNGFTCIVLRGWGAPTYTPVPDRDFVFDATVRAPICFNPGAVRTVLPYQELRAKLAMEGKGPDQIAEVVQAAYATGKLPRMEAVAFAYMFSADMYLGPRVGHFHPHVMVYAPYYDNKMLGGNPRGTLQMRISDDEGTPFAVTVIPVDHSLAVKSTMPTQ